MQQQAPRPPYVKFERRAVEDRTQAIGTGKYGFKDVDVAKITVPGQKDTVDRFVEEWLSDLQKKAEDGRVPPEWPQAFRKSYDFWKSGQEMPLNGTAIKGWPPISPAQQENLIACGILTVEDLAQMTDEAARNLGIGASSLKQKAGAWLHEAKDKGSVAEENNAMKVRLDEQQVQLEAQAKAIEELKRLIPKELKETVEDVSKAKF